jgi:hypothetical protein
MSCRPLSNTMSAKPPGWVGWVADNKQRISKPSKTCGQGWRGVREAGRRVRRLNRPPPLSILPPSLSPSLPPRVVVVVLKGRRGREGEREGGREGEGERESQPHERERERERDTTNPVCSKSQIRTHHPTVCCHFALTSLSLSLSPPPLLPFPFVQAGGVETRSPSHEVAVPTSGTERVCLHVLEKGSKGIWRLEKGSKGIWRVD